MTWGVPVEYARVLAQSARAIKPHRLKKVGNRPILTRRKGYWDCLALVAHRATRKALDVGSAFAGVVTQERERWVLWVPVALGAGIGLYFQFDQEPSSQNAFWWASIGFVLTLAAVRFQRFALIFTALLTFALILIGLALAKVRTEMVRAPVLEREISYTEMRGRFLGLKAGSDGYPRLVIAPIWIDGLAEEAYPAKVRLSFRGKDLDAIPGDIVEMSVSMMPPPSPVSPNGFDFARQAWYQQIGAVGYIIGSVKPSDIQRSRSLKARFSHTVGAWRLSLSRHIRETIDKDTGAIAAALITGDRSGIQPAQTKALREASLAHLLAISGLHMGLAGWALFSFVRFSLALIPPIALRFQIKKIAAALGLIGSACYLVMSGASISSQRAFIMIALIFVAILFDRPAFTLRMVAIAATIILVLKPESLLHAGFQMSFAAVTVLVSAYEYLRRRRAKQPKDMNKLDRWFERGPFHIRSLSSRALRYVSGLALTSFLAGIATAPFAAFHFNQVANYGLIANLLAVPFMGIIVMPMAVLAMLLMPFGLDGPAFKLMALGIDQILVVAEYVSHLPNAVSHVISWPNSVLVAIVLGGLWLCLWQQRWRLAGLIPMAIAMVMITRVDPPDLLIDREAKNVAVRALDGRVIVMKARSKYSANTWSRRGGQGVEYQQPEDGEVFNCDILGCVFSEEGGPIIAYVSDGRAFQDECADADILISDEPVPGNCRSPKIIVDQFDVRRDGAYAIWLDEGNYRILTASEARGDRPWSDKKS